MNFDLTNEDGDVFPLLEDFVEHLVGDFLDLVGLLLVQEPAENLVRIVMYMFSNRFSRPLINFNTLQLFCHRTQVAFPDPDMLINNLKVEKVLTLTWRQYAQQTEEKRLYNH